MTSQTKAFTASIIILLLPLLVLCIECIHSSDCDDGKNCTLDFCEGFRRLCFNIPTRRLCRGNAFQSSINTVRASAEQSPLTSSEQVTIAEEAGRLFRDLHVFRYLHKRVLGKDAAADCFSYAGEIRRQPRRSSTMSFHQRMMSIFKSVDDGHTIYIAPSPLKNSVAFLPFRFREFYARRGTFFDRRPRYVVTDVGLGFTFGNPAFQRGAVLLKWDGVRIHDAVMRSGQLGWGANEGAKRTLGIQRLTARYLAVQQLPEKKNVEIEFLANDGQRGIVHIDWVYTVRRNLFGRDAVGLGSLSTAVHGQILWEHLAADKGKAYRAAEYAPLKAFSRQKVNKTVLRLPFIASQSIGAATVSTSSGTFGLIALYNFSPSNPNIFIRSLIPLLMKLPKKGLIIDARGNTGGSARLCQGIVQLLTKKRIKTVSVSARLTPLTLKMAMTPVNITNKSKILTSVEKLARQAAREASQRKETYFGGFRPLQDEANSYIGRQYSGPVTVLIDGNTYSCGEAFTAAFKDSTAGIVVGTDESSGGGGGGPVTTNALAALYPSLFRRLPGGVQLSITGYMLVRGGKNKGQQIEYVGVKPNLRYYPTKRDREEDDHDLLEYLGTLMKRMR